jgi:HPt (histidine-containing phosphotransfer) domain-containing protein
MFSSRFFMPLPDPKDYMMVLVDPDIVDMVDEFLENQKKASSNLRNAMEKADLLQVRKIGHTLKGVGGMYGFDWITQVGLAIQEAAEGNPSDLPGLSTQLDRYLHDVRYRSA